jgi:hypothetical protein
MIYDILYRDAGNYKKFFRAEFPDNKDPREESELTMEESGLTVGEFFSYMGWSYDPDYDHNILEVTGVSEDQIEEPQIRFTGEPQLPKWNKDKKEGETIKPDEYLHFAVDIPSINHIRQGNAEEWVNVDYFATKEEAIKWAQDNLGADEEGRISVISQF